MKTSVLVAAILASALSAPVLGTQEKAAPAKPAMSMDMNKRMPQLQENMKKMHQQMEELDATKDPIKREKLMDAHLQTMQQNMAMIRSMGGPIMKGVAEHAGMKSAGRKGSSAGRGARTLYEMMEQRMDSMQRMMEQMLSH